MLNLALLKLFIGCGVQHYWYICVLTPMKSLKLPLLCVFFLLFTKLSAGSFIGGDVRYRHLTAKKYEITIAVYRDCRGIGLNSPPFSYVYNDSFQINLTLTRVKIEEIKAPACAGGCITNTPSNQGDEKHTFLDTIDFSVGPYNLFGTAARPLVYFSFEQCCRNGAITTYAPGNMYVEAMLNLYYANQNNAKLGFNDFLFPAETYLNCWQTHNTSYRTMPYQSNDSLVYEMVRAKEDKNAEANYDPYKPLTFYCNSNPGNTSCTPNTLLNPVRGFFFNRSNGNLMCTPGKCDEVGTMVCRVGIYRPSGDTMMMVGYMKRDYQFIVRQSPGESVPYILKNRDYTIKAREQFCVDIPVKDDKDALQAQADTVLVTVIKAPVFGKLSLLDSNTREKTLHYCWTPTDADYLNHKMDEFIINGDQKKCLLLKKRGLSTTIQFQVVAPDSLCSIRVKTYEDKNKNGKKDGNENYSSALFFTEKKSIYTPYWTDSTGTLLITPFYGQFKLGIQEQLEIVAATLPQSLNAKFDSAYVVELGYIKRPGIKGRVYEDKNNNCVFDGNDVALSQQNVVNLNRMAITDSKGNYFIETGAGSVTLKLSDNSAYLPTCNTSYQLQMPSDSVLLNKDFAVRRRAQWTDLGIELISKPHLTQGQMLAQDIKVTNYGFTTQRYVTVKLVSNRRLPEFKSNLVNYKVADTFLWVIDSIRPLSSKSFQFEVRLNKDTFKKNDQVCYTTWIRSDSVNINNVFSICENAFDSVYQSVLKSSKNPASVHDLQNRMCYQLAFIDYTANHNFLLFRDTLDEQKFDIKSLQVYSSTPGLKVNLLDNILVAEYAGTIVAGTEIFVRFGLALKTPFKNSFEVENTAVVKVDNRSVLPVMTVFNSTRSAVVIEALRDTVYCPGEKLNLGIGIRFSPERSYPIRILLSDSNSNFSTPTILKDTTIKAVRLVLPITIPIQLTKGSGYKLKVVLTDMDVSSFEDDFTQTIQVHALPQAGLISNLRKGYICSGDTLKTKASGADSVVFFYNTYQVNTISTKTDFNFVPYANGRLQALVKDFNGCEDSSAVITFNLHPLPKIGIQVVKEVCYGDSLTIKATGAKQYQWYANSVLKQSSADSIYKTGALKTSTWYRVEGTDSNACFNMDSVKVLVNPLPLKPQLYAEKARFYSSYPLRNQWYLNQLRIDTAINQYYYPPVYGLYSVEYTDLKGCKAMSEAYDYHYVSISASANVPTITAYPNPFNNSIIFNNPTSEKYHVDVMNIEGKIIYKSFSIDSGSSNINSSHWPAGLYILVIYNNDQRSVVRMEKVGE